MIADLLRPRHGVNMTGQCGPCERGCATFSYFSSPFTTVADAVKSGNCKLITNAVVSHIDMDDGENKARGVTYVDRVTHKTYQVRSRAGGAFKRNDL